MKKQFCYAIMLTLSACAQTKTYTLPETLTNFNHPEQIACRFTKQTDNNHLQTANWYFWRQANRSETHDELSNQGEIWEYNNKGDYFYTRLFNKEKVALEFVSGDLAATSTTPSLSQITSLVDPKTFGKELTLIGKENHHNLAIEFYKGKIKNVATEVDWLPSLNLPARLVKNLPEGTVTLSLVECGKELDVLPISKAQLDSFRHLDYTDLGDMEDDPTVKHIEELVGGNHHNH